MNPEIKKMWADALRSGKYVQGTRYLKYETPKGFCHCALGVLCDLAVKAGVAEWLDAADCDEHPAIASLVHVSHCGIAKTSLHTSVADWSGLAGISCTDPELHDDEGLSKLSISEWNDVRGATFHQIAEMIEEQL